MATQNYSIYIGNYKVPRHGVNRVIVVEVEVQNGMEYIIVDDTTMGLQLSGAGITDVENSSLIYRGQTNNGFITLSSISTGVYQLDISDPANPVLAV